MCFLLVLMVQFSFITASDSKVVNTIPLLILLEGKNTKKVRYCWDSPVPYFHDTCLSESCNDYTKCLLLIVLSSWLPNTHFKVSAAAAAGREPLPGKDLQAALNK